MLRVGSLFSGAGLCDLGLARAGFNHQFFCEVDPFCRAILARHWPGIPIHEDIRLVRGRELPPVDALCGGFPCQDVSSAGKRSGIKEGTRSGLWREYARIVEEIRPRYVIIENVRGLLARGIEIVLRELADIGYDAEWEVLPAAAFGAPHHRERVFVVAYPHGLRTHASPRLFAPLGRILGNNKQFIGLSDWLGIRIDRASKTSIRQIYGGRVLCRVDDGGAPRMDGAAGDMAHIPASVGRISPDTARAWIPRLKALGNGIVPHQAYAVAACILEAEGLAMPTYPF